MIKRILGALVGALAIATMVAVPAASASVTSSASVAGVSVTPDGPPWLCCED